MRDIEEELSKCARCGKTYLMHPDRDLLLCKACQVENTVKLSSVIDWNKLKEFVNEKD